MVGAIRRSQSYVTVGGIGQASDSAAAEPGLQPCVMPEQQRSPDRRSTATRHSLAQRIHRALVGQRSCRADSPAAVARLVRQTRRTQRIDP